MSVNISAHQLMAPDFVGIVSEVLAATATPPGLLTLEITEAAFVQDPKRALVVLTDLKELGVLLALDDFGTGYSSLSCLKQFPVDILKIDRTFTADLIHDPASHAIVTKIIELAHMLDLAVVSEGVETAAQRAAVSLLGSEFYQGYYFARPMSAESVGSLLAAGPTLHTGRRRRRSADPRIEVTPELIGGRSELAEQSPIRRAAALIGRCGPN